MNNHQLKTLLTTAQCGSFTKAEEKLFLSKQAIKKQIDSLEEELGFQLLIRTRQGIALTEAGEEFCRRATSIVQDIDDATQRCRELSIKNQIIRIANPDHPRLLLEHAFKEFSHRFPSIKQQVMLRPSNLIVKDILTDQADVAEYTYSPEIEDSGVAYMELFPMTYNCLVSPNHPLASKKIIYPEDLSGCRIGLLKKNIALAAQLRECCHDFTLDTFSVNCVANIVNTCYNNGVFISRAYFVNLMKPLVAIPLESDYVPMGIILHRNDPSQVVKEFLNIVREVYLQNCDESKMQKPEGGFPLSG